MREDFQELHAHKEAGMASTIVMGTFPVDGEPIREQVSGAASDLLLLLQVVADPAAPDASDGVASTLIGRFDVEGCLIGDGHRFAEARYDLISRSTADELNARGTTHDDTDYVLIADPMIDAVAESLSEPGRVLL